MQTAVSFPQNLKKLVIVDIANKVYRTSYFEQYLDAMLGMDLREISTRKDAEDAFLKYKEVEPVVLQFLLKNLYREKSNSFKWHLNLTALKENMDNLLQAVNIESPITTDTLFMKGSESGYITTDDETVIHEQFAQVKIETITGANHWVHFTARQNFIRSLKHFQKN
jgi:pimeloyl-ACP methyl ester carboxylesterase